MAEVDHIPSIAALGVSFRQNGVSRSNETQLVIRCFQMSLCDQQLFPPSLVDKPQQVPDSLSELSEFRRIRCAAVTGHFRTIQQNLLFLQKLAKRTLFCFDSLGICIFGELEGMFERCTWQPGQRESSQAAQYGP